MRRNCESLVVKIVPVLVILDLWCNFSLYIVLTNNTAYTYVDPVIGRWHCIDMGCDHRAYKKLIYTIQCDKNQNDY
jgi:hypothetical protein